MWLVVPQRLAPQASMFLPSPKRFPFRMNQEDGLAGMGRRRGWDAEQRAGGVCETDRQIDRQTDRHGQTEIDRQR